MLLRNCLILALLSSVAIQPVDAKTTQKRKSSTAGKTVAAASATSSSKEITKPAEDAKTTATASSDTKSTLAAEIKSADTKESHAKGNKTLVITVTGEMQERGESVRLLGQQTKGLKSYLDLLRRAREDSSIKTIVLRLSGASLGLATAQELRLAVQEARDKGKTVLGFVEDDSQASYLVALACNEVIMPPSGDLMLHGVSSDSYFLKNLLEKVGVSMQIVHVGQYKSYGETFTNDDFTTPARQNMTEIVDDIYNTLVSTISADRKISPEDADATINNGPASAEEARSRKLVDRVAYADEVLAKLKRDGDIVEMDDYTKDSSSGDKEISLLSIISMMSKSSRDKDAETGGENSKLPQVAVIYAVGPITLGSSEGMSGFSSEQEIKSDDIIETLEEIKNDDKIKAVLLRVNSPGGSAFASDLIWRKIEEVKKTKPVVASMGDMAASGGYYISMGANKIFAEPGTLTGSIGVVGGKPNLQGLYGKLGVNKTSINKGAYSQLFSESSPFNDQERSLIEKMMKNTYDEFVTKAAAGRKTSYEQLHEVAQGRVWTGSRAKEVGLVDELGGMTAAIQELKGLIGVKADDKVALVTYPKEMSIFDYLQKSISPSISAQVGAPSLSALLLQAEELPRGLRMALKSALSVSTMFQRERVLAVSPWIPVIH